MNDSPDTAVPAPSHAVAKGVALGLGVLLLGGTALLITLLVTRNSVPEMRDIPPIELQAGEKVTDVTLFEEQALFLIERNDGQQRVLLLNLTTGAGTDMEIRTP